MEELAMQCNLNEISQTPCWSNQRGYNKVTNRVKNNLIVIMIFSTLITGCATQTKSIALGAVTGTLIGTGVGALTKGNHYLIGGGVGLALGGLSGKIIYDYGEKKKTEGEILSIGKINNIVFGNNDDVYINPRIEKIFVAPRVSRGKKSEGFWEWYIAEPGHFKESVDSKSEVDNDNN